MPYVTEEIYQNINIKDHESIMEETYEEYNKEEIYKESEDLIDKAIIDITSIRNLKANNSITKEAFIKINSNKKLYNAYKTALKINDEKIIKEDLKECEMYNYKSNNIEITYYEKGKKEKIFLKMKII